MTHFLAKSPSAIALASFRWCTKKGARAFNVSVRVLYVVLMLSVRNCKGSRPENERNDMIIVHTVSKHLTGSVCTYNVGIKTGHPD